MKIQGLFSFQNYEIVVYCKYNDCREAENEKTYLDISLALGFSSQSSFISVFKKKTGMTPKEYRLKNYMNDVI